MMTTRQIRAPSLSMRSSAQMFEGWKVDERRQTCGVGRHALFTSSAALSIASPSRTEVASLGEFMVALTPVFVASSRQVKGRSPPLSFVPLDFASVETLATSPARKSGL
jgi:hypothetical protein